MSLFSVIIKIDHSISWLMTVLVSGFEFDAPEEEDLTDLLGYVVLELDRDIQKFD